MYTIINPTKLLNSLVNHRLDTLRLCYVNLNSDSAKPGIFG